LEIVLALHLLSTFGPEVNPADDTTTDEGDAGLSAPFGPYPAGGCNFPDSLPLLSIFSSIFSSDPEEETSFEAGDAGLSLPSGTYPTGGCHFPDSLPLLSTFDSILSSDPEEETTAEE
jgi:hypothetical protein